MKNNITILNSINPSKNKIERNILEENFPEFNDVIKTLGSFHGKPDKLSEMNILNFAGVYEHIPLSSSVSGDMIKN